MGKEFTNKIDLEKGNVSTLIIMSSLSHFKGDLILFLIPGVKFASDWEQAQARMYVMSRKYMHDVLVISVNKTHHWLKFTSNIVCLCLVLMMMRIFDIVFH